MSWQIPDLEMVFPAIKLQFDCGKLPGLSSIFQPQFPAAFQRLAGLRWLRGRPTTFYDSLVEMTTINFEELAEEENWEVHRIGSHQGVMSSSQ